jgi:hypothetical protein
MDGWIYEYISKCQNFGKQIAPIFWFCRFPELLPRFAAFLIRHFKAFFNAFFITGVVLNFNK